MLKFGDDVKPIMEKEKRHENEMLQSELRQIFHFCFLFLFFILVV